MALAEEKLAKSSRSDLLRVGFATIVFVAIVNIIAIGALRYQERVLGTNVADHKWHMLDALRDDVDWLILGDSSGGQGLDPSIISERLGGSALNLCTIGSMLAIDDAWMLQRYLESHSPPKAVFVVHVYDVWYRDDAILSSSLWKLSVPSSRWSSYEPRVHFTLHERFLNVVGRWIPLYSRAKSLKTLITRAPFKTTERRKGPDRYGFESRTRSNPENVRNDLQHHKKRLLTTDFSMSRENQAALDVLGRLSDKYELPVYLVPGPILDELANEPTFQAYVAKLDDALSKFTKKHVLIRQVPRAPAFTATLLENVDHLVGKGPAIFTRFITDYVERNGSSL